MKLHLAWIGRTKALEVAALTSEYVKRIGRYATTQSHELRDEAALLELVRKQRVNLVVLDSRGKQLSSEEFAAFVRRQQESGVALCFAIGPADGFSDATRAAAQTQLSLGKMTLAHELARVVLLEQVYRAFTILKGHPYHTGH